MSNKQTFPSRSSPHPPFPSTRPHRPRDTVSSHRRAHAAHGLPSISLTSESSLDPLRCTTSFYTRRRLPLFSPRATQSDDTNISPTFSMDPPRINIARLLSQIDPNPYCQIMTGEAPFHESTNLGAIIRRITALEVPNVQDHRVFTPFPDLAALLQQCWSAKPEDRPKIADFLEPLRKHVSRAGTPRWVRSDIVIGPFVTIVRHLKCVASLS